MRWNISLNVDFKRVYTQIVFKDERDSKNGDRYEEQWYKLFKNEIL